VRNTGNVTEQFTVTSTGSTPSNWQLGSTNGGAATTPAAWAGAGSGIFTAGVANQDQGAGTQYMSLWGAPALIGSVTQNNTQPFYLIFQAPTSTGAAGVAQSITFTVTGTAQ
jgi:hypothetical protein